MSTQVRPTTAPGAASAPASPGIVWPMVLPHQGSIGCTLQSQNNGRECLIKNVLPGSQADRAGLKAGDLPVFPSHHATVGGGEVPMPFETFLKMCQSGQRPLFFSVRRSATPTPNNNPDINVTNAQPIIQPTKAAPASGGEVGGSKIGTANNENVPNGASTITATATATAAASIPMPPTTTLLAMTSTQLHDELNKRNIHHKKRSTKDDMLELLGVPVTQWRGFRTMKKTELQAELKKRNQRISGNKDDLLVRLGVPEGFGETSHEKFMRESRQSRKELNKLLENKKNNKKRKVTTKGKMDDTTKRLAASLLLASTLSAMASTSNRNKHKNDTGLNPEDDPTHEMYEEKCCDNPTFNCRGTEPAGCINWPDGSVSEVWRCTACNSIPKRPNAPAIHEFSSDDEGEEDSVLEEYYGNRRHGSNDCVIQ